MDYTPQNRHEKYLNAIRTNDTSDLPTPITREEKYLSEIAMNSGGGSEDYSVKYTEQSLTSEQQAQARGNIGAAASTDIPTDAVKYTAQSLTSEQQAQARTNIGAAASADIPTDAVKYTAQTLTAAQKTQARENIGAAASTDIPTDAVKYTAQTLTDAQKTQARTNIGAVQSDWNAYNSGNPDFIKNKPPVKAGQGTGGNLNGGTGMNNMNEATKQNSIAYGYAVSAKGDYSAAFGYFSQALHDYEWAIGKYNQSNPDTAFSIGDGTSNSDRHNLMELKTDGTLLLNGNAVKTESGDDNKLRLGQICAVVDGNLKIGFADLFTASLPSFTFSASDRGAGDLYKSYLLGDFIAYREYNNTSYGVVIAPIAGRSEGISKTGKWIYVENCYGMFRGFYSSSSAVKTFDLSMLDTSEVKNMGSMFDGSTQLTALDLSPLDTSNVIRMSTMFCNCTSLTSLDLSSFDMSNVVEYRQMFGAGLGSAPHLTTLKTPKINPHDDIPLNQTLYSQDGTAYTNLPVTTGTSIELRQSWT